ncbi:PAS domain-containing protein [Mycolicibacterium sp. Y3]
MVDAAVEDEIRRQLTQAMAIVARPMSLSALQRYLAKECRLYIFKEALYQHLAVLEKRGEIRRVTPRVRHAMGPARAEVEFQLDVLRNTAVVMYDETLSRGTDVDGPDDCVKVIRVDGTLLTMNAAGCAALGLSPDENDFGMQWLELLPGEFRRQGFRALQAARNGNAARFAGGSKGGDGPRRWDNILTPVESIDGRVRTILCISRDITDLAGISDRRP